jgi:uncharacterized protein DUF4432
MTRPLCSISEHVTEQGYKAVTLENEILSVTVLPSKGADIYALLYKPRNMDVLWKSPWGLKRPGAGVPTAGTTEEAWLEHYGGGWQEIFPNGGDACVYKGCHLNFHGEVSVLPWKYTIQKGDTEVSVEFSVSTYRSPFQLRRRMTVKAGRPVIHISEKLQNYAEEEMQFMWGHHPAYGAPFLDGDCFIQLPGATFQAHDVAMAPISKIPAGMVGSWPCIPGKEGTVDLSQVPPMTERHCEFGYLRDLTAGWYTITSRKHDFGVGLAWPVEFFKYLWFWQELRGSFGYPWHGRCYVMAIEPFTSIPGTGLQNAIKAGTAPVIAPLGSVEVNLAAFFVEGQESIESVDLAGNVVFASRA